MILIDTSVWIAHFRAADPVLITLLEQGRPRLHPFVLGELALGSLPDRANLLRMLRRMQSAEVATPQEALSLIAAEKLESRGIRYVDVHLLASARLMGATKILTHDERLATVADQIGLSFRSLN